MATKVESLEKLVRTLDQLLETILRCSPVLFEERFRILSDPAIKEARERIPDLIENRLLQYPEDFEEMRLAGLSGAQLQMKLQSFEASLNDFEVHGGQQNLSRTMSKLSVILGSLAGAIPGFGSFAQELIDFLLKELKKVIDGE